MIFKMHVNYRAGDLSDASDGLSHMLNPCQSSIAVAYSASAPEMISINSFVIMAWRVRL